MQFNSRKSLAKMDKNRNVKNKLWIQVMGLDSIIIQQNLKEITRWNSQPKEAQHAAHPHPLGPAG